MAKTDDIADKNTKNDALNKTNADSRILSLINRIQKCVNVRLILTVVGGILAAIVALWIVDKVVFYYLARTYVEEVASVLDLNKHLANALVLLTFVVAIVFASYIWAFSKKKRLIEIVGICSLLTMHSLALWYGTRNSYFDPSGKPIKCYVLTREGQVTYGEHPGIDAVTGRLCRPVTAEMLERLKQYETGKRPRQVDSLNPTFFDPRTGEPIVWYRLSKSDEIKLFDLMGFDPDSGEELLPITKDIVDRWKTDVVEVTRHVPKRIDPSDYVFFDLRNGEPRAWHWRAANGGYEFYDSPGFQPQTGDKLEIVTREIVDAWKKQSGNKAPQRIDPNEYSFFDPTTGAARVWYWRGENKLYEFYDAPGFQPRTGDKLLLITRDIIAEWKQASIPPPPPPRKPEPNNTSQSLEFLARSFVANHHRVSEGSPSDLLDYVQRTYAVDVDYYGTRITRQKVLEDQRKYVARWQQRSFRPIPEKTRIVCDVEQSFCDISEQLYFRAYNPADLKISAGITTHELRVLFSQGGPSIVSENGMVISRKSSSAAVERVPQVQPVYVPQQTIPPEVLNGMLGMVFRGLRR